MKTDGNRVRGKLQAGSALILALSLIVILGFMGFGLLMRSSLGSRIAGTQMFSIKTRYAASSGIEACAARLAVGITEDFVFEVPDLRGARALPAGQSIRVEISLLYQVGPPVPLEEEPAGREQEDLDWFELSFSVTSRAGLPSTGSHCRIGATLLLGPVPMLPDLPLSEETSGNPDFDEKTGPSRGCLVYLGRDEKLHVLPREEFPENLEPGTEWYPTVKIVDWKEISE